MKIPFDIKYRPQIESGEYKVETRDGRPVRIICWDRKPLSFPISALVSKGIDSEESHCYSAQGQDRFDKSIRYELIIVTPEPELSEFEKELSKCLCDASCRPEPENYNAWAKEYAPKLFELAKKEVMKDMPKWRKPKGNKEPGVYTCCLDYDENTFGLFMHCGFIPTTELEKLPRE